MSHSPLPRPENPPHKDLELANASSARETEDHEVALVICSNAEDKLSHVKCAIKRTLLHPTSDGDESLCEGTISAYTELDNFGQGDMAQVNHERAGKLE